MLSRVAENLYWLSRYVERAENVSRIIDVNHHLMLDMPSGTLNEQWEPIIIALGEEESFKKKHSNFSKEKVIDFLTFDEENPNSIISAVNSARFNARTVRESISPEMWEELNNLYHNIKDYKEEYFDAEDHKELFDNIIKTSHLFVGTTDRTLMHDEGWHFIRLGRMLERADKTSRILDLKYFILLPSITDVNTPLDDIQWGALLKSASAFESYRRAYNHINYDSILKFLILEKDLPRSIRYCINGALRTINNISPEFKGNSFNSLFNLSKELEHKKVDEIKFYGLHEYIDLIQQKLNDIGDGIYQDYFYKVV
ncbi:MAG: alpha-E domain-containing protein [Rickettsiales bacterium]|nr:alpha-E domain-containing protein [Rickettsiales bacterium]